MCEFNTKIYEAYYPELDSYFYFEEILHVTGKKIKTIKPRLSGALVELHSLGGGSLVHLFHNDCKKLDSITEILGKEKLAHFTGPFQKQFKIANIQASLVGQRTLHIDEINFYIESKVIQDEFYLIKGEIKLSVEIPNAEDIKLLPNTYICRLIGGYALFMIYFNSLSSIRDKKATFYERIMIIEGDSKSQILEAYDEYSEITKPYSELSKKYNYDLCRFL